MSVEEQLWAETRRLDWSGLPFVRAVTEGRCPKHVLQAYALDLTTLAEDFVHQLPRILASCDDVEVRHAVLANLLEEEGIHRFEAGTFASDPAGRHGVMAGRLARAFGADPDLPRSPIRSTWLDARLDAGDWVSALAFLTVGYEANVPAVFKPLADGLRRHYGYADADIEFLVSHVEADEEHGADGVAMVAAVARTPDAARRAIEGARRGTLAWYQFHRKHGQAVRRSSHP